MFLDQKLHLVKKCTLEATDPHCGSYKTHVLIVSLELNFKNEIKQSKIKYYNHSDIIFELSYFCECYSL